VRTHIEIDDALIADVMRATGARTKREAVELGLKTLLRLSQQQDIRRYRGKLPWTGSHETMRSDG
jgi:Arc/MetJ family transcription regulator